MADLSVRTAPEFVDSSFLQRAAQRFAGLCAFLYDPSLAAKQLFIKRFWIFAFAVVSIGLIATALWNVAPITRVILNQPIPEGYPAEQYRANLGYALMFQRISAFLVPVFTIGVAAVMARIALLGCALTGIQARYSALLNLVAGISLIRLFQVLATAIIIHAGDQPTTIAELQPPIGLDLLLGPSARPVVVALLGYVNVFQLWSMVMAILVVAAAFRTSKTRAALALCPMFLAGLAYKVVPALFAAH